MAEDDVTITTCTGNLRTVVRPGDVEHAARIGLLQRMRPLASWNPDTNTTSCSNYTAGTGLSYSTSA